MTQAVRRLTAEKGTDPVDLKVLAYGGNGPLFAAIQAQELGIAEVLVPKASPTFSALGALTASPGIDEERSYLAPAESADLDRLASLWGELDERAERFLLGAGYARDQIRVRYLLNLRYPGQNWSLGIEAAQTRGPRDLSFVAPAVRTATIERFHQRHVEEYGHSRLAEAPEVTGVRLVATVEVPKPDFAGGTAAASYDPKPHTTRRANLGAGFETTGVFHGADLRAGARVSAPAIIEESFTTIAVYPGWRALVDDAGDYILERRE